MTVTIPIALAVTALAVAASVTDVRTRRIPNRLTGPALLAGLLFHAIAGGPSGLGQGALGALVAGGILLPGWLMGWMGAGDVKLLAALGAWLAFPQALTAALLSLMAGGVLALVTAMRHRVLGRSLWGAAMMGAWAASGVKTGGVSPIPTTGIRFPFGLAILAGTVSALWIRL